MEAARRRAAPEAHQLHGKRQARERLGRMVVVAESTSPTARIPERPDTPTAPALKVEKNVDTMARAELLALSDKIIIDGASLRQVYETRLVGERGLRRLISEHLQGGNVKKLLRKEIVEREIDFERDPAMRDQSPEDGGTSTGAGGQASLKTMLDRVEPTIGSDDEEKAYYKARTAYDTQQQSERRQKRRAADVSMGVVIAVLIALVLILLLSHQ
jgi:hypothetical protein